MSPQADYVVSNGTGAAVRSDINGQLAAIISNNSGATEPATMYAYQWWADTTTGLLKIRNSANNAWVTVGTLASANLGLAALASPTFTGTVTAPTFTASTAVNIPLGSAGSPTLFFTGDSNNGLFSPGADIVALTTDGSERFRIAASGQIGLGGANYGTSGQALTSNGSGSAPTWQTPVSTSDKISEGNTEAEVVDTGSDGHFKVTTEGSERLRVDPSGRLLVGTSTASSYAGLGSSFQLEQSGGADAVANVWYNNNDALGPYFILGKSRGTTAGSNTVVSSGDVLGTLAFFGADGTDRGQWAAHIRAEVDGTPGANDMPGRIVLSTTADGASSPTARIIINSGGTLYPATDNAFQAGTGSFRWTAIYAVNGTIQTSDARQKTDVSSCSLGSAFIKSLQPVSYKWIEGGNTVTKSEDGKTDVVTPVPGERTHWGFLAQDVKAAVDDAGVDFGGWILTDKDDPDSDQGLRYDQFIAPLTKALQETMAELEALKAEVAALKAD